MASNQLNLIDMQGRCFICVVGNATGIHSFKNLTKLLQVNCEELLNKVDPQLIPTMGLDFLAELKVALCESCSTCVTQLSNTDDDLTQMHLHGVSLANTRQFKDRRKQDIFRELADVTKRMAEKALEIQQLRKDLLQKVVNTLRNGVLASNHPSTFVAYALQKVVQKLREEFAHQCEQQLLALEEEMNTDGAYPPPELQRSSPSPTQPGPSNSASTEASSPTGMQAPSQSGST